MHEEAPAAEPAKPVVMKAKHVSSTALESQGFIDRCTTFRVNVLYS